MEQFKIKKDGFKEIRNAMLIKSIPISLLAALGGLAISYFNTNGQQNNTDVFPYLIPLLVVAFAFGIYRSINRQKEIFDSYQITIDHNGIAREQYNTPTIIISKAEISEIIRNSNGSFSVKGNSSINTIGIPSQIEDYEKLEKLLAEIKEITIKYNEPILQKFRALLSVLTIGLLAAVYISKDKVIVGASGLILLVVLAYSFFKVQRSKNIDSKTKKAMWWIITVIAFILVIMYYKLTGQP